MEYDVLIIGGGPAGVATGLTILKKPGIKVGIIEQSDYSDFRVGEVLSPGMRNMLEYFEVWEEFKAHNPLDAFSSRSIWGSEELSVTDYLFTVHGSGWHLDRASFDRMMAKKFADKGGELMAYTKYLSAEEKNGQWTVKVKDIFGEMTLKTKYIVDATGRKGIFVNERNTTRTMDDQLVGVGCFGTIPKDHIAEQSILIEATEYGWWYSAPTPNNHMSVILMTDLDMVNELNAAKQKGWKQLLESTKETSKRVKDIEFIGNPRTFMAYSSKLSVPGGKNWLAVGDAFSSHDPLSSSGIPHALGSGAYAGRVVVSSLQDNHQVLNDYTEEINAQYASYLKTKASYYNYEQRWPKSKFWKRRNEAISIMADKTLDQQLELPKEPVHLSEEYYGILQGLHTSGVAAHELVQEFKMKYPQVADESVILGLQEMVC